MYPMHVAVNAEILASHTCFLLFIIRDTKIWSLLRRCMMYLSSFRYHRALHRNHGQHHSPDILKVIGSRRSGHRYNLDLMQRYHISPDQSIDTECIYLLRYYPLVAKQPLTFTSLTEIQKSLKRAERTADGVLLTSANYQELHSIPCLLTYLLTYWALAPIWSQYVACADDYCVHYQHHGIHNHLIMGYV